MENTVDRLVAEMTLNEKAALLAGLDMWSTVPVERARIPSIQVSDGPNGVRGTDDNIGATSVCFPVGIAMGATWNRELVFRIGERLGRECRLKGAHVLLAPTVNIHRSPIAGRNFECFAEDPFLSGMIAAAYINGLQSQKVGASLKHFVANDQEFERFSISSEVAERPLHEIYLEPFRIAVEEANPWTVMSAYNRINGVHASENEKILRDILKESWGYDGVVVSDWYGTYSEGVMAGGLDLEMPGPARWMAADKVVAAVQEGRLSEKVVDDKVIRLLRLMQRVGALDSTQNAVDSEPAGDQGAELTRAAAAEAIVLLKNEGGVLPLDPEKPQSIVVIGENARWAQIMGGGSAQVNPHYAISPLSAIQNRVGPAVEVSYQIGTLIHRAPPLIDPAWLTAADGETPGLTLDYFHNLELRGEPAHSAVVDKTQLSWFGTVNPFVDPTHFSLRLTGTLTPPEDGEYLLHLWGIGRSRLEINGETIIELEKTDEFTDQMESAALSLAGGEPVSIVVEYITDPDSRWRTLRLGCVMPMPDDPIQAAVKAAAAADVAVIVAGLTYEWEGEGSDRLDMRLPGRQDELIRRVASVNANTVVVLNSGSPVEMPWVDDVRAIAQSWYGGQEAGNGFADVLFGDVNPSGKLPTTFPRRLQDNPAYINFPGENGKVYYGEGVFVGYRYYDKKEIEPLFPFGHGLSYTSFAYANLEVNGEVFRPGEKVEVRVAVTNTGQIAGQEVIQLYVHPLEPRLARPKQELKAFAKISLEPGESRTVILKLDARSLAFFDPAVGRWVTESGDYELRVGSSSRDIRLRGRIKWEAPAEERAAAAGDPFQLSTVAT